MKFIRNVFAFLLILIILGGVGYLGYNYFFVQGGEYPNAYHNYSNNAQTPKTNTGHGGMNMTPNNNTQNNANQGNITYSSFILQSKDELSQLINSITQSVDLITMDPYSRITLPGYNNVNNMNQVQPNTQGGTSINIYPNVTAPVNITPPVNTINNTAQGMTDNEQAAQNAAATGTGYVYDQGKLEQLHSGIFKLAQGIMLLNQLNDDLTMQSTMIEPTNMGYQNYINRYQLMLRNKTKLNNAIGLINDASSLINVNPYASSKGYQYDITYMDKLHTGIYKLAQSVIMASELNEDFTNQMARDISTAQNLYNINLNSSNIGNVHVTTTPNWGAIFNLNNLTFIFNLILAIMIVTLIVGIFGAIGNMLKVKPTNNMNADSNK
ncbi:MAG: hypothetical protein ACOZCL_13445 [Bacillota bacterium]